MELKMKTTIEQLEEKKAKLAKRISDLKYSEAKQKRKADNHLKIVLGGLFLSLLEKRKELSGGDIIALLQGAYKTKISPEAKASIAKLIKSYGGTVPIISPELIV
jgi:molybdopterin converting factor small subunit